MKVPHDLPQFLDAISIDVGQLHVMQLVLR